MRQSVVIISILVVVAALSGGVLAVAFTPTTEELTKESEKTPEIVTLTGNESGFWPYLNTKHAFQKDSPINIVVRENATHVVDVMQNQTAAEWTPPPPDQKIGVGEWGWSDHYAYVHNGTEGEWIDMTAELHDGDYYGTRYHVRLYESPRPNGERVLIQAHTEYFDWFTLSHTVTGTERGQQHVEKDLTGHSTVEEIWHTRLGNADSWDSDGKATVVEFALVLPVLLLGKVPVGRWTDRVTAAGKQWLHESRRGVSSRHALLAGSLVGLVLGVRIVGIVLERYGGFSSMTPIAALLFPFISVGIPVATYGIARRLGTPIHTALTAALALSVAIVLDLLYVGGDMLPVTTIVQRAGLIVAVGLIAGGAARRSTRFNGMLASGVLLWGGLVVVGLLNLI